MIPIQIKKELLKLNYKKATTDKKVVAFAILHREFCKKMTTLLRKGSLREKIRVYMYEYFTISVF